MKFEIIKRADDKFEVVGIGHSGNDNDALYGTFTFLSAAFDEVHERLHAKDEMEIIVRCVTKDSWSVTLVPYPQAQRKIGDLLLKGGRSTLEEIAKWCNYSTDDLPVEALTVFTSAAFAFHQTIYAKALDSLLSVGSVVKEETFKLDDNGERIVWYRLAQRPTELEPDQYPPDHPRASIKIRIQADVTPFYARYHMFAYNALTAIPVLWLGTFHTITDVFKVLHDATPPHAQSALRAGIAFIHEMHVDFTRLPLIFELENGSEKDQVRLIFSGITREDVARIVQHVIGVDTIYTPQILENGLTLDMQEPHIEFLDLKFERVPHNNFTVTGSSIDPVDPTKLNIDIKIYPVMPVDSINVGEKPFDDEQKNFMDYFTFEEEYPREVAANPIPINTHWSYIASTFLNGIVPYVRPITALILDRYQAQDEIIDEPDGMYRNLNGDWVSVAQNLTKRELLRVLFEAGEKHKISNLKVFNDDVLLLTRVMSESNMYVYFWFDHDVSDCCIGRFVTDDPIEEVRRLFLDYGMARAKRLMDNGGITEIPLNVLDTWLSF